MPMRVIGAGFGRTGTMSMQRALEELGFGPTYHMQEVVQRPSHSAAWLRYARTGEADWDALFADYASGVDYPVSCVWAELADHFPDAKVVLTVRDPEAWWRSTVTTIFHMRTMFPAWVPRAIPHLGRWLELTDALVWDGLFDGRFEDRDHAVAVYERHVADVIATCPPERLLVFDVAEGWEPLCAFLDVPVPASPFPRLNDAASMRRRIAMLRYGPRVLPVVAAAGVLALVVGRWRR